MQIDIHERKKPSVILRGSHAQACPTLPNFARGVPGLSEGWDVAGNERFYGPEPFSAILDHRLRNGPMDSGPSVCPSVTTFLRIGSSVFSDLLHEVRGP